MRITIVTISYNQVFFLKECIESVLSQKDAEVEYIIVDPGSTDGSRELITSYADQIDTIIFEPDQGPADGLNNGFSKATGDIFGYINADDYLLPGALNYVQDFFDKWPEIDVINGDGLLVDKNSEVIRKIPSIPWNLKAYLYGSCPIVQQSTFFREMAFEAAGGFNITNRTCWDGELLVDMAITGARFKSTRHTIGSFRIYGDSITGSGRLAEEFKNDHKRIHIKAMGGSSPPFVDMICKGYYRTWKWVQRPSTITSKLSSMYGRNKHGK